MRKFLPLLFMTLCLLSCSEDCEQQVDHDLIAQITEEIKVLEEKRDNAPTQTQAEIYQNQIEKKQKEMNNAFGGCE